MSAGQSFIHDSGVDYFAFVIARSDVDSRAIEPTLGALRSLLVSVETVRRFRARVEVVCEGYEADPRELWEIPEVRSFVARLDDEFPYWLYFLDRGGTGLWFVAKCFMLPDLTPEADRERNGRRLAEKLERRWLPALKDIGAKAGWSDDDIRSLCESAVEYFTSRPSGPAAEAIARTSRSGLARDPAGRKLGDRE